MIAGAGQWSESDGESSGAALVQPSIDIALRDAGKLHATLGFAVGDGLHDTSRFQLAPWAADLESDVQDINGSGRDHLLTAWYEHNLSSEESRSLTVRVGIIDATEHVDINAYANDEITQYLNEAFVNAPSTLFPAYDVGVAVEWSRGPWSVHGVVMHVDENDASESFLHLSGQIGYALESDLGAGAVRLTVAGASDAFPTPDGASKESLLGATLSVDQAVGDAVGLWARFGMERDEAAIAYERLYSAGVVLEGDLWGRPRDRVGLGYARLSGGNTGIESTDVFEAYARFALSERLALTIDAQHMRDERDASAIDGWILGARLDLSF